jgi:hypothetical protein
LGNQQKDLNMTKSPIKSAFLLLGMALGACTAAHGLVLFDHGYRPEIDPSLAVSALTLLAGSLAVLSVRRKK